MTHKSCEKYYLLMIHTLIHSIMLHSFFFTWIPAIEEAFWSQIDHSFVQLMFIECLYMSGIVDAGEIREKTDTIPWVYFIKETGLELVVSRWLGPIQQARGKERVT